MYRIWELIVVTVAAGAASFASWTALKSLEVLQNQNDSQAKQLELLVKQNDSLATQTAAMLVQTETLKSQVNFDRRSLSNQSAIAFLDLRDSLQPEWVSSLTSVGIGGEIGFEKFNSTTIAVFANSENTASRDLLVSLATKATVFSCRAGLSVDFDYPYDAAKEVVDKKNAGSVISPDEEGIMDFSFDLARHPRLYEQIVGSDNKYLVEFSVILYAEGADKIRDFMSESAALDGFNSERQLIEDGPFFAKRAFFHSWLNANDGVLVHSLNDESCDLISLNKRRDTFLKKE